MQSGFRRFWRSTIVATFLSGLFAILPVVLTVAIVGWVAQKIYSLVGPETAVGKALHDVGTPNGGLKTLSSCVLSLVGSWIS